MRISKTEIIERLQTTSVHDLAVELTDTMEREYQGTAIVQRSATIAKFEKMLKPFAPTIIKGITL